MFTDTIFSACTDNLPLIDDAQPAAMTAEAGLANLVGRLVTPLLLAPATLLTVIGWQTEAQPSEARPTAALPTEARPAEAMQPEPNAA